MIVLVCSVLIYLMLVFFVLLVLSPGTIYSLIEFLVMCYIWRDMFFWGGCSYWISHWGIKIIDWIRAIGYDVRFEELYGLLLFIMCPCKYLVTSPWSDRLCGLRFFFIVLSGLGLLLRGFNMFFSLGPFSLSCVSFFFCVVRCVFVLVFLLTLLVEFCLCIDLRLWGFSLLHFNTFA